MLIWTISQGTTEAHTATESTHLRNYTVFMCTSTYIGSNDPLQTFLMCGSPMMEEAAKLHQISSPLSIDDPKTHMVQEYNLLLVHTLHQYFMLIWTIDSSGSCFFNVCNVQFVSPECCFGQRYLLNNMNVTLITHRHGMQLLNMLIHLQPSRGTGECVCSPHGRWLPVLRLPFALPGALGGVCDKLSPSPTPVEQNLNTEVGIKLCEGGWRLNWLDSGDVRCTAKNGPRL